jgi:hypothetical protein
MLKKGSQTNLDVALSAVQLEKHKLGTKAAAMVVKNAKCSQLFALLAEKIRWFHSNRLVKSQSIVASVLYPLHATTGKSFIVEAFPSLKAWEGFFLVRVRKYNFLLYTFWKVPSHHPWAAHQRI